MRNVKPENRFDRKKLNIIKYKTLLSYIKWVKILTIGDIEVVKDKCHHFKSPILVGIESVNKVIVSNKIPFYKKGFKYFVGYKDDRKVK